MNLLCRMQVGEFETLFFLFFFGRNPILMLENPVGDFKFSSVFSSGIRVQFSFPIDVISGVFSSPHRGRGLGPFLQWWWKFHIVP